MKKLMIAAAIVCAAAYAQAATIAWGGAADDPSGSPLAEGQIALLLYSATDSLAVTPDKINGLTLGSTAGNGTVVDTFAMDDGYADSEEFYGSWTPADKQIALLDADGQPNGYYAILIANEDGTAATYQDMGQLTGIDAKTGVVELKYNAGWEEGCEKYLGTSGYVVEVQGVPEPTSGLLLLIGVAGLALRRRRA